MPIPVCHIAAGRYTIGNELFPDALPVHQVDIGSFALMTYAVTNAQYAEFTTAHGYEQPQWWTALGLRWLKANRHKPHPAFRDDATLNTPDQPVVGVGWYEALAFAAWLTHKTQLVWRLPTEVEWEAAAHPGTTKILPELVNCQEAGIGSTITVTNWHPEACGAFNLLGNVWEWCSTRWGRNWQKLDYPYPYTLHDGREVKKGSFARVIRGGSWYDPLRAAHPANRARYLPGSRASNIGFRLVYSV
jgi:formylglycine-generating enzyme required for sulfatase activity